MNPENLLSSDFDDYLSFTQFDDQAYLDQDYAQAQEQLAFDWVEMVGDDLDLD